MKWQAGIEGICWFNYNGQEISKEGWTSGRLHHLGMLMDEKAIDEYDWRGRLIEMDSFLLLINVGTFSPAGNYAEVEERLDYLADLGIMPLNWCR